MLAALAFEANQTESVHQLVERVWGTDRLPTRPAGAVRTYVSLLRRGLRGLIARRAGGYALTLDPDSVDMHRFDQLLARARAAEAPHPPRDR